MSYRPVMLKESDRYRGRRRAPAPSRRRYAAVLATAAVGAGAVALSTGATLDDAKTDPATGEVAAYTQQQGSLDSRADAAARANRGDERSSVTLAAAPADAWVLPLHEYELRATGGDPRQGIDLTGLPEGTPFASVHDGTVLQAGWNGGFGNSVIVDHGDGVQTVYAHASKVLVTVGQQVRAGEAIALLGNTGFSRSPHLHLEVYAGGAAQNPVSWFQERGLDFDLEIEATFGS